MQPKNLTFNNYNSDILKRIPIKKNLIRKTNFLALIFILFSLTTSFAFFFNFYQSMKISNRSNSIADFKLDINKLSEATSIIESERKLDLSSNINSFGSDGQIVKFNEISPDLQKALANISNTNHNGKISEEEIEKLRIMRLNPDAIKKELKDLQFNLKCGDSNFKNYLIITNGKYAGTILYNGPLKFIDNENKRYFGLELSA